MAFNTLAQIGSAPPAPTSAVGAWDVQSFPLHPQNATLAPQLINNAGDPYLMPVIARATYTASTPLIDVKTDETQADVMIPIPPGTLRGSDADALLMLDGPNGWYSMADGGTSTSSCFGATHIPFGAPQWFEPGPNSTSAARIPFGFFSVEDVLNNNFKTLAFSVANPGHGKATYPADVTVSTDFSGTGACTNLGTMIRLPRGTVIDPGCDQVETFICNCLLKCGAAERDEGFSWGWRCVDYINQGGNKAHWDIFGSNYINMLNGTLPYARKCSTAFKGMLAKVEVVTSVSP